MSDLREIAVTSNSTDQLWNACIWDPHVGSTLMTYKGGSTQSHGLSFINRDYLVSADPLKPLLHVWALNRREQLQIRMVLPGTASALAVSPDGSYCVCGIGEKLHVWHVSSGRLMAVLSKHFQRVTCVKFTDDSSHFASAAEDGTVVVWPLCRVVALTRDLFRGVLDLAEPRYSYGDHSLPVTDIFIGKGGIRARLLSSSLDGTVKMYDLASGELLLDLVFGDALTSITMSSAETNVFVGATNGKIFQYCLHSPPRSLDYHVTEKQKSHVFFEHTKAITSLSVSSDGVLLMSGSLDEQVVIWDVSSMQCLRKLQHKGPVTNAFFSFVVGNVFSNDFKPSMVLSSFKKETNTDTDKKFNVHFLNYDNVAHTSASDGFRSDFNPRYGVANLKEKDEVQRLKKVNNQLYEFVVKHLLEREVKACGEDINIPARKKLKAGHHGSIVGGFVVTDTK